jgi:hypothetical protein
MGMLLDLFGTITSVSTEHISLIDTFLFKGGKDDGGGYDDDDDDEDNNSNK